MLRTVLTLSRSFGLKSGGLEAACCNMSSAVGSYKTLSVTVPEQFVYHVELNRPEVYNALSNFMWQEVGDCFNRLADEEDCRVIVLSGAGKLFCSGIDLKDFVGMGAKLGEVEDVARKCKIIEATIKAFQEYNTSLEKCSKPVVGATHGACIGGGVNLIVGTDIRYCTKDAYFQVKEVELGLAADVGALQRLPKVIGSASLVNELCLTGRKFPAAEALNAGFVSRVFDDKEKMMSEALVLANSIAKKSPVAVQGTKRSLVFSRDHSVQEGLDHIRDYNKVMLQSEDFLNASVAVATKSPPPIFSKL